MRLRHLLCLVLLTLTCLLRADPLVGDRLQQVTLVDRTGATVQWSPGRVTVFSFFAYWCDTWRTQAPRLFQAKSTLKGLPIDFATVSIDGRWLDVRGRDDRLPTWLDKGAMWSHRIGVDRVPTTVIVAPSGEVRWVRSGVVRSEDIIQEAKRAMTAAPVGGVLYLTFDDFPASRDNDELLDSLRALSAPATFFCIGSKMESHVKLLKRAIDEGHELGCHSWSHEAANPGLDKCHQAFMDLLGQKEFLYRAPGSSKVVGLAGKYPVVDPYDFSRPGVDEIVRRCVLAARPGAIIQLHAGVGQTLEALPKLVEDLRKLGYRFEVLP